MTETLSAGNELSASYEESGPGRGIEITPNSNTTVTDPIEIRYNFAHIIQTAHAELGIALDQKFYGFRFQGQYWPDLIEEKRLDLYQNDERIKASISRMPGFVGYCTAEDLQSQTDSLCAWIDVETGRQATRSSGEHKEAAAKLREWYDPKSVEMHRFTFCLDPGNPEQAILTPL